ncbi:MAG: methyltransferase domain-containing protein [Candidatus Tectomicrobia bacterium]|nr:methyltransferase domain-containing protein [Candidatus Tectomicrobia bacterium]
MRTQGGAAAIFTEPQQRLRREVLRKYTEMAEAPAEQETRAVRLRELAALGYPRDIETLPPSAVTSFSGVGCPLRYAEASGGERVLDVGVGPGLDAILASRAVGPQGTIVGLDMNPAMLRRCAQLLRELRLRNARLVQGDGELLPFADASFDLVISNGVSNLSPRKDLFFGEMARVLRRGGRLALADVMLDRSLDKTTRKDPKAWSS